MTSAATRTPARLPHHSYTIQRTLRTLEILAFAPATVTEVADSLGIHIRTARRLVNKLVDEQHAIGVPRRGSNGARYSLTPKLLALAAEAAARSPLLERAAPLLDSLERQHHATAMLALPSYRNVLMLTHHEAGPLGWQLEPAHATAAGKALLAHRPNWLQAIRAAPLERCRAATVTDSERLAEECARVRERGYATERNELRDGRSAIAVVVPAAIGSPVASVSLASDDVRDPQALTAEPLTALKEVATQFAHAMPGYAPSP